MKEGGITKGEGTNWQGPCTNSLSALLTRGELSCLETALSLTVMRRRHICKQQKRKLEENTQGMLDKKRPARTDQVVHRINSIIPVLEEHCLVHSTTKPTDSSDGHKEKSGISDDSGLSMVLYKPRLGAIAYGTTSNWCDHLDYFVDKALQSQQTQRQDPSQMNGQKSYMNSLFAHISSIVCTWEAVTGTVETIATVQDEVRQPSHQSDDTDGPHDHIRHWFYNHLLSLDDDSTTTSTNVDGQESAHCMGTLQSTQCCCAFHQFLTIRRDRFLIWKELLSQPPSSSAHNLQQQTIASALLPILVDFAVHVTTVTTLSVPGSQHQRQLLGYVWALIDVALPLVENNEFLQDELIGRLLVMQQQSPFSKQHSTTARTMAISGYGLAAQYCLTPETVAPGCDRARGTDCSSLVTTTASHLLLSQQGLTNLMNQLVIQQRSQR